MLMKPSTNGLGFKAFSVGGFTLIELIITIVILGIGVTAFLVLVNQTTRDSVDPLIRQQAGAVAQAYMDEVLLNPFCDPDFSTDCRTACTSATACTTCSNPEGSRNLYDDVCDYDGLSNTGARDRDGSAIAGLGNYNVQVTVDDGSDGSAVTLNTLSSNSGQVVRVDVRVTHSSYQQLDYILSGFRVNY